MIREIFGDKIEIEFSRHTPVTWVNIDNGDQENFYDSKIKSADYQLSWIDIIRPFSIIKSLQRKKYEFTITKDTLLSATNFINNLFVISSLNSFGNSL